MFFRKLKLVFILFIGFFIKSLVVNAQCDPNQKYDKIVSGYHQSIALKQSGIFSVWGQDLSSSGTGDILSPIDLISSNYSALTGTVLKVSIGGEGGTGREQAIALTTDGLFAWGTEGKVLSNALTTSAAFQKIQTPTNGDASTKLPTGVSPSDVSMIQASNQTLAILTNSGNVWMLTQASLALEGNGGSVSTSGSSSWKKVKTSSTTDLTNVIAIRGQVSSVSLNAFAALTSSGDLYTWGSSVYLGNNTASTSASYATLMTLPVEFTSSNVPKMIGVTGGFKTSSTLKNTYYILSSNGSLYALGDNSKRQCGDFTTSERRTWVNSKINSSTNFNNVNTISVQEHDASFPGISAITFTGDLYTWGENDGLMLGRQTEGADYDPGLPGGFVSGTDKAIFAELGGHTLVYIKEGSSQFCYVGHKVAGSMGDGSSTDTNINTFDCSNTPNLEICGSVPVVASTANSTISANPTSITADGNSTSTITIQLKDASGNNLTTSGGVVVVTTSQGSLGQVVDNNNGTYTVLLTSSSNTGTATINFKINGNNATNSTTVAFSQAPNCSPNVLFKLSPPNVSTSAIQGQVGTKTENFNSFADEVVPASGAYAIGNFVKTGTALRTSHKTDAIYGAPLPNSTTSSRYLGVFSGNVVNVTLTEPSKYLGFWWAGGDAENQVTIFGTCGGNEIQLAQFTTSAVTSLLSNPTITAIDGNVYNSVDYIRGTPFAYINLQLDNPSISFTRLEFTQRSGEGGFEVDNITTGTGYGAASNTTPSAPTITSISPTETSLTVNFTAPTSDGGSPITNYEYTTDGGTTWTAFSPTVTSSPVTITGLVSGTNYPVKLRAVNAIGSGAPSNTLTAATVSTLDSDGDGITDVNDPDDDGDGIIDGLEQDCSASTGVSESLNPSPFYFVQWNSFANGVLSGVINVPGETINVTVTNSSNSILLQNDDPFGGTSDWAPLPSGNASLSTFRSLTLGEHKFVFDKPVNNPRFFINSLNKTLDLSLPGKILKSNGNFAGAPVGTTTQVLVGNEGTGTISFAGNITQISFTGRESELYCNFSLGISGLSDFSTCLDIDTDLDGTPDRLDLDSDGDGVTDAQEIIDGTSPTDLCSFVLINQTLPPTATWETTDCDNDGFDNKTEVDRGSDPLVANAAPTNILLSPSTINENVAANATIGAFSTSDLDVGNTFTYTLVSGTGATDNGAVNISGSNLRITASPDFETKSSYTIRVRSTDQGGLFFEKTFTVTVIDLNETPTDIALSANSVNENVAANSTLGSLSSSDVDADNTFTYTLVSGTGATDNGAFNISGNNLRITASPDFEAKSSYTIRVRSTDQGGLFFEKTFTITVIDLNETPTDIALSANSVNENVAANSTLGSLSSSDVDAGSTFTYTLVSGTGATDNGAFNISGSNLRITASPDFETKSSYTIRVRSTDQGGLFFEKTFTITVIDLNETPTDIALSANSVNENVAANSTLGSLSSSDVDAGSTFTYTLVSGTGATDNGAFNISGSNLRITASPDFETKSSYAIRVRSTDQGGLFFEKAFTVTVIDLNETPTDIALSANSVNENVAANSTIGSLSSSDVDAGSTFTYTLVSGTGATDNGAFNISGSNLRITASPDFETKSSYAIRVRSTDQGGLFFEKAININVIDVNEAPTNIALSTISIYEKNGVGAVIGNLSSTDEDAGDKHSYSLVSGDVAAFRISGNQLQANVVYTHATKNIYDIVVKSTDAGGLTVNKAIRITILQSPVLFGSANLPQNKQSSATGQNVTISKGYSANLNLSGSNIVKYAWSPSTGLSATNISNPIANPTQTTTYTVRVTNAQGVSTDVYITVIVLDDYNITPNNVLSPDGDGVNDFWTIENLNTYPNNEVKIFDKAGRVIYSVRNYQNNWNGQLNGETLHEGAYYYVINLGPGIRPKIGYITLFSNK